MASLKTNNKRDAKDVQEFRGQILSWYDKHARILPWRAEKGQKADPYHVWLSEIMLQQTTVGAVIPYFTKFLNKWPRIQDLAAAERDEIMSEWAGLGYYARARNLHKCAQVVTEELSGVFPQDEAALKALPGIGEYTSAAIAAIAFDRPATVVDGNIERIMARYFAVKDAVPGAKKILKSHAHYLSDGRKDRPGDYAQALMDIGASICTPRSPKCGLCPINQKCKAHKQGIEEELPAREKKLAKPQKFGFVYWVQDKQGRVLLHRRSEKGMLGGMIGLPTSKWVERKKKRGVEHPDYLDGVAFETKAASIHHSFTHFDLELALKRAISVSVLETQDNYFWCDKSELKTIGFPSLFSKAIRLGG
ncbi:MAG: A/G-specific adenine glycosylase [Micavibrio sp.]|nr:MAG: A/G-specific adenine glycosylase [Micavibrio sp.]